MLALRVYSKGKRSFYGRGGLSAGLKWARCQSQRGKRLVAAGCRGCRREGLVGRADYNLSGEQLGGGMLMEIRGVEGMGGMQVSLEILSRLLACPCPLRLR